MPKVDGRGHSIRIRMSDDERNMMIALGDADGLTASDVVRQLVRRAYADKFGDKKPRKR